MKVIDSQIHPHAANSSKHPWRAPPAHGGPPVAPPELHLRMMDEMGVDAAIVMSSSTIYGHNPAYALEITEQHPDRFGVIYQPDPLGPDVGAEVEAWAANPVTLGVRMWLGDPRMAVAAMAGEYDTFLGAAQDCGQPVCFASGQRFAAMTHIAERFPRLQIVLDHLGLYPPIWPGAPSRFPTPGELLAHLPDVLELGRRFKTVAIKVSRVPTMSLEAYPYRDIWEPIRAVVKTFGPERSMWGTDWTTVTEKLTYREAVDYIREIDGISDGDLQMVMGGALERVFKWSPSGGAAS